jgi:hypothetical protein
MAKVKEDKIKTTGDHDAGLPSGVHPFHEAEHD